MKENPLLIRPEVSIIIPVYQTAKFLPRCLDSVLSQTLSCFEVICINDGSIDGSDEIIRQYSAKDHRIRFIEQTNQGASVARNAGLDIAQGRYIFFLDSDDCIHSQALALLINLAEKNQVDLISFGMQLCTGNPPQDKKFSFSSLPRGKITDNPLFLIRTRGRWRIHFNACNKFFKSELLTNYRFITGISSEDVPFSICLMKGRPKTLIIKEYLYYYMYNEMSMTKTSMTCDKIKSYRIGVNAMHECYKNNNKEHQFIKNEILPSVIKQLLNGIFRGTKTPEERVPLLKETQCWLKELNEYNLLSWRGHKWQRYRAYKALLQANSISDIDARLSHIFK